MKTVFLKMAVPLAALFSLVASAQQEQWLEYHTSNEPKGYRWLELSTNPPPGVLLPAGLKPGVWFGRWNNGLDASGERLFCLDSTRKGSTCDRLFFDINGDGRLNDEAPINVSRRESTVANFDPIKFVFKGEDGPVSYHLIARFYAFDKTRAQLLIGAGGWYEGTVSIAGKPRKLQLIDNTVNGVFNDVSENSYECDRIVLPGGKETDRYLGSFLEVDGQLMRIEVAKDGAFIKLQPAEGIAFGTVKIPETVSEFSAFGPNGHFVRQPKNGELTLPSGKYRVHGWGIDRKDDQGVAWKLSGAGFKETAAFEVSPDNPASLEIGEPVTAALTLRETKVGGSFDLKLQGTLGEGVEIMRAGVRSRPPQLHLVDVIGTFRSTNTFEYG